MNISIDTRHSWINNPTKNRRRCTKCGCSLVRSNINGINTTEYLLHGTTYPTAPKCPISLFEIEQWYDKLSNKQRSNLIGEYSTVSTSTEMYDFYVWIRTNKKYNEKQK